MASDASPALFADTGNFTRREMLFLEDSLAVEREERVHFLTEQVDVYGDPLTLLDEMEEN